MDLKESISETISAIVEATSELQQRYEEKGVVINPPLDPQNPGHYLDQSFKGLFRRVEVVSFDVAVTAASARSGGGRAVRILAAEASAGGEANTSSENVSRVKFTIPIVLSAAAVEAQNRAAAKGRPARPGQRPAVRSPHME